MRCSQRRRAVVVPLRGSRPLVRRGWAFVVSQNSNCMGLFDFLRPKRAQPSNTDGGGLSGAQPSYGGGDGLSVETAIVVNATSSGPGVRAEYEYVTKKHGQKGEGWKLASQDLIAKDGRHFDVLKITLKGGQSVEYYFDISQFYGIFGAWGSAGCPPVWCKTPPPLTKIMLFPPCGAPRGSGFRLSAAGSGPPPPPAAPPTIPPTPLPPLSRI